MSSSSRAASGRGCRSRRWSRPDSRFWILDSRFRMSSLRFRFVLVLVGLLILGSAGIAAEAAYRARVRSEFKSLERSILNSHPRADLRVVRFLRFGESVSSLEPSLFEDLSAALFRWLGVSSSLDSNGCECARGSHAYYLVAFGVEYEGEDEFSHIFIWSPSKRRFIHGGNRWAACLRSECPWRLGPRDSTIALP